jgi:acetoin utilization deacetylase AcuC-like enzyme
MGRWNPERKTPPITSGDATAGVRPTFFDTLEGRMRSIRAFFDDRFAAPIGDHVMPIGKFRRVADAVRDWPGVRIESPEPVTEADLLQVHSADYVNAVRTGEPRALAESQKFPWSPELYESVRFTNGAVYAAAEAALQDGVACAVASGFHHAHAARGEGFCTFNGLIVAIDKLRAENKLFSAAVLDLDLHYGNGTAQLIAERPYVTQLSIYGNDYWNNTPYRDVTTLRHTDGENHFSAPLLAGCRGPALQAVLNRQLPRLLTGPHWPELLIYQAGADPLADDPYSPLALTADDLLERDRTVFRFAREHGIPIAWVLAGGYTKDVSKVVDVHVNTFKAAVG